MRPPSVGDQRGLWSLQCWRTLRLGCVGHATLEVPSGVAMDCAPSIAKECLQLQNCGGLFKKGATLLIEG